MKLVSMSVLRKLFWSLAVIGLIVGSAHFQDFSRNERFSEHRVKIVEDFKDTAAVKGFGEFQVREMKSFSRLEDAQTEGIYIQFEVAQKITIEGTGQADFALFSESGNSFLALGHMGDCNQNAHYIFTSCWPYFEVPKGQIKGLELVISLNRGAGQFTYVEPQIRIPLPLDSEKTEELVKKARGNALKLPKHDEGAMM